MKKKKWCAVIIIITTLITVLVSPTIPYYCKKVSITTLTTPTCPGTVAPTAIPGSAQPQLLMCISTPT
jgi:hypothetical protein